MTGSRAGAPKPAPRNPVCWTPDLEAEALRLYLQDGLSASQVADRLGGGVTRSAVLGKVHRLGLRKRPPRAERNAESGVPHGRNANADGPKPRKPRVASSLRRLPPPLPPRPLPPLREVFVDSVPVRLAALGACACRWPIDDPGEGRMDRALFCAAPAAGDTYCPAHRALSRAPARRTA